MKQEEEADTRIIVKENKIWKKETWALTNLTYSLIYGPECIQNIKTFDYTYTCLFKTVVTSN